MMLWGGELEFSISHAQRGSGDIDGWSRACGLDFGLGKEGEMRWWGRDSRGCLGMRKFLSGPG
jgi:hypothetical protein